METCEVTFDETMPHTTPSFETIGEQEMSKSNFVKEEQDDGDWGDQGSMLSAVPYTFYFHYFS